MYQVVDRDNIIATIYLVVLAVQRIVTIRMPVISRDVRKPAMVGVTFESSNND